MNNIKLLLIISGFLSLTLGLIGIVLPVLPTTPFILLSSACFLRSSKKYYNWLNNNRYFGSYIRNYRERRVVPFRIKVFAISSLWITITASALFAVDSVYVKLLLFVIAILVTIHLLKLKTI